jgi:hypothetical protein
MNVASTRSHKSQWQGAQEDPKQKQDKQQGRAWEGYLSQFKLPSCTYAADRSKAAPHCVRQMYVLLFHTIISLLVLFLVYRKNLPFAPPLPRTVVPFPCALLLCGLLVNAT